MVRDKEDVSDFGCEAAFSVIFRLLSSSFPLRWSVRQINCGPLWTPPHGYDSCTFILLSESFAVSIFAIRVGTSEMGLFYNCGRLTD